MLQVKKLLNISPMQQKMIIVINLLSFLNFLKNNCCNYYAW